MSLPFDFLDKRPIIIALAGSNGAGKSTFYESQLADGGLRFINADELSASLGLSAYGAAELAASIRRELVNQRESFIFETVLSDPVGEKVDQLASYAALGYTVVLIFIRIQSAGESSRRVAMRVCQGGHDVPDEKIRARFSRTLANLQRAIQRLPHVIVFSNEDLTNPYQLVAHYENGQATAQNEVQPRSQNRILQCSHRVVRGQPVASGSGLQAGTDRCQTHPSTSGPVIDWHFQAPATGTGKQDLTLRRKARKGFVCGMMLCNAWFVDFGFMTMKKLGTLIFANRH